MTETVMLNPATMHAEEQDRRNALGWYSDEEVKMMGGRTIFTWLHEKPIEIPDAIWDQLCHCVGQKLRGFGYDEERNMWVNMCCGKPNPAWINIRNCEMCEDWYVVYSSPDRDFVCKECKAVA